MQRTVPNSILLRGALVRTLALVLAAAWLGGCGYQLRGSAASGDQAASLSEVYVDGPGWLVDEFEVLLESSGGEVLDAPRKGAPAVKMVTEQFERRIVSVDSSTGKTREIEIVYTLRFNLRDEGGAALFQNERLSLRRDLSIDPDAVLGKVSEESLIQQEMQRDAASQLLRRVQSALAR